MFRPKARRSCLGTSRPRPEPCTTTVVVAKITMPTTCEAYQAIRKPGSGLPWA
jgi:hypothetical protein